MHDASKSIDTCLDDVATHGFDVKTIEGLIDRINDQEAWDHVASWDEAAQRYLALVPLYQSWLALEPARTPKQDASQRDWPSCSIGWNSRRASTARADSSRVGSGARAVNLVFPDTAEHRRLAEIRDDIGSWRRWGPYVSDRAWATVREDYSADGDAWEFFRHDLARSKAYRWGEDGIAGICDRYQLLCFAPAFWNGRDPILKERLFGLTPHEGNHGEDVKEYYFYLDNTPTHSYMKFLYKYPQGEFPYARLVEENRAGNGQGPEFELLDTGIFDEDRYFDIVIEYAKATPEDIVHPHRGVQPRARGGAAAHPAAPVVSQHLGAGAATPAPEPTHPPRARGPGRSVSLVDRRLRRRDAGDHPGRLPPGPPHARRARRRRSCCSPTTKPTARASSAPVTPNSQAVRQGRLPPLRHSAASRASIPTEVGTKAALHYRFDAVPPGGSVVLRLRLSTDGRAGRPLDDVDDDHRPRQARGRRVLRRDPPARGQRRRTARSSGRRWPGLLWTKQSYLFDVHAWLDGDDPTSPPPASRRTIRNQHWRHLNSLRVMTMPDKWEYPWFAAWDLAFHCVAFALVDPAYAKDQLWLLLFEQFQHPNGQIPAYEWEFSDLNPPVHAWAVWRVYNMDRIRTRQGRPRLPRALLPQAAHQFRLVGQQGRPRRATTSSRAASSAWTTSPSSIAATRCDDGRCSSSPTPPAGWACSA